MHESVYNIGRKAIDLYTEPEFTRVLEVGSQDVNGSMRDHNSRNLEWIGVDFEKGKGVDVLLKDPYNYPFEDESFDMVVASSVFEHSEFFWKLFMEMVRLTKPGGIIFITAPHNGHIHRYPVDVYRFYPDSARALANWAKHEGALVDIEETFILERPDAYWCDWVAVFRKGKVSKKKRERVADSFPHSFFEDPNNKDDRQAYATQDHRMIDELNHQIILTRMELDDMRSSKWWKLTYPGRRFLAAFKRKS